MRPICGPHPPNILVLGLLWMSLVNVATGASSKRIGVGLVVCLVFTGKGLSVISVALHRAAPPTSVPHGRS